MKNVNIIFRVARIFKEVVVFLLWKFGFSEGSPHCIKEKYVKRLQSEHEALVFIETGTYLGDMVHAVRKNFEEIYSIELSEELYKRACERFSAYPNIHIVQGDSGKLMPEILSPLTQKCLFWLDGHYSGGLTARGEEDYPLINELKAIAAHPVKNHVILVDDARLLTGADGAPSLEKVISGLKDINSSYTVEVKDDTVFAYLPLAEKE